MARKTKSDAQRAHEARNAAAKKIGNANRRAKKTAGRQALRANIAAMKKLGAETRAARAEAHAQRNADVAAAAAERKAARIEAHNNANEDQKHERLVKDASNGKGLNVLTAAFAKVSNPVDWRFGVDAVIEGHMSNADYVTTMAAITFFTRGAAGSIRDDARTEFFADGFYMNTLGDCAPANPRTEEEFGMLETIVSIASDAGFPVKPESLAKAA
ncbi:hypothetical protein [uncultured Salinicola sp.]|uniref:hypothetical protein n=1 Tax=uncultured Salinicola sp. TaxID=1193542 RepID=UPI00262F7582|nr:hypothetical protein [uncultured Salinicola sp.]